MGFGADKIQSTSFRLDEDFSITYGREAKALKIPRMSFVTGEKAIKAIAGALSKDASGALKIIGMSMDKKEMRPDDECRDQLTAAIEATVRMILEYKMYGLLKDLLGLVSEESITEAIQKELQFTEAVGILNFLLDENLKPLKNLLASLGAITTSGQSKQE